jgi:hypothetical protein
MIKLTNLLIEKHLTPAEKKKKEEIVKTLKKSNPKMPKPEMYAIATEKAKKLAECDECGDGQKTNSSMLKGQLRDLIMNTSLLYKVIEPGRELPGWIVSYISLADDYIHSVKDHVMEWKSEHGELDEISASPYHFNEVEVTGYVYDEQADVEVEPVFKAKFEFKKGSDDADLVSDIDWNKEDFDDNENNAIEKWLKVFKNHNEIENQLKDKFFETYEDSEDDMDDEY